MIVPMKKLLLAARQKDQSEILNVLQQAGVVHVEPCLENNKADFAQLNAEITKVQRAIEVLEQVSQAGNRSPVPGTPTRLVEDFYQIQNRRVELENTIIRFKDEAERIRGWGRINGADLDRLREKGLEIRFLQLSEKTFPTVNADLIQVIFERDGIMFAVAVSRRPIVAGAEVIEVKQPEKDVFELEQELVRLAQEQIALEGKLADVAGRLNEIREYFHELNDQKRFSEVESKLLVDGPVFVLTGWIPEPQSAVLEEALKAASLPAAIQFEDPADTDAPPTQMQNAWWCRPIEVMFQFLGITPGYREADISPFFFPFLIIFTAMLVGDAGYGLCALVALGVSFSTLRRKGVAEAPLQLGMALFAGTAVYGALTNSWFGTSKIKLTSFDPASPEGEEFLKYFCFLLGSIHITIAHAWKIRRNPINLATLAEVGWIIFLWAMRDVVNILVIGGKNFAVLPGYTIPMFYVSLSMVTLFTAPPMDILTWHKQGLGGILLNTLSWIGQGLGAIALNAAAFLSDIISYIRLWAVGLAGGILGASFNDLASSLPFVFMVIVLVAAHLMNFALGIVAILAHGVRLNLLEFSNHLGMEWSGREYNPFRKEQKK